MAKLNGVRGLDMTNGDITKVSYQGEEYTKVGANGVEGDIVRVKDGRGWGSQRSGEFYSVERYYGSKPDDFTTVVSTYLGQHVGRNADLDVFRKSPAAVSAPFEEMITTKVSAVEQRVSALEDAKESETTPKFNEGDRVKALRDGEFGDIESGEYGVISDAECERNEGDPYSVHVSNDDGYDFFRPQDLELATEKPAKPVVGDIVVITGNTNDSRNKVGDIGKVVEDAYNCADEVKVDVPARPSVGGEYVNFTKINEMRHATHAEVNDYHIAVAQVEEREAKDAVFTNAGRNPNEYRKGDVVRITFRGGVPTNFVGFVEVVSATGAIGVRGEIDYKGAFFDEGDTAEIVCFAEDRKDAVTMGGR